MIKLVLTIVFIVMTLLHGNVNAREDSYDFRKSVVKIFSTEQNYDYIQPWQKRPLISGSGSGFVILGNRIMTNAHVVANSKYLQVKKFGDPKLYTGKVVIVGNDCDLAIIEVEDTGFFNNILPFEIGELPSVMDEVVVLGYPIGGDELNITRGIVSRVEHVNYTYSFYQFLGCQIDATINPGNSGGPVIDGENVVGVAFQGLSSQDLSYMIPPPIINHFLKDIEDGEYDGFSDLLISYEYMINDDLREYFKMPDNVSGILVYDILPESPVYNSIQRGDIITSMDGVKIADDGTVEFRDGERTIWGYLTDNKFVGEKIEIELLRDGKTKSIETVMKKLSNAQLVPYNQRDEEPKFFVAGGIVFQTLTVNYLLSYGKYWYNDAPRKFLNEYFEGKITPEKKEVVFISSILPDDLNNGYQYYEGDFVVSRVNGKKIAALEDVINIIDNTKEKFLVIEDEKKQIVLRTDRLRKANSSILKKYNVVKDRSDIYLKK